VHGDSHWVHNGDTVIKMTLNFEGVGHEGFINTLFFSPILIDLETENKMHAGQRNPTEKTCP
jgi:hypothetical protein